MASYHLAVKTISRSSGRSATGAAAYRAGERIVDDRTGVVHDYSRRHGVEHSEIVLPTDAPAWAVDRERLWNAAEQAEGRRNSTVAREFEVALPAELDAEQRRDIAVSLAREISERHGVAVDVAIHAPGREGDHRNHHAHLLVTTRRLGWEGLGEKTRELDQRQSGEVERWRARWADIQNRSLERAGMIDRVDHRSFERQGIDGEREMKQGPAVTAMERRSARQAEREGRIYEPATEVGRHNAAVKEKRGLHAYIERGSQWLQLAREQVTQGVRSLVQTMNAQVLRDREAQAEHKRRVQREKEKQREIERERQREIEKTRRQSRNRRRDQGWER